MIVFLTVLYVALLFLLVKRGVLPNSKATWLTIIPYELVLLIGFFIPMQWGAPAGAASVMTFSVPITPNVAGEVLEVPVQVNEPLKKGDVLFRIDPIPYQAAVDGIKAQLALAELRLEQSRELAADEAGSIYEVQAYEAQVAGLQAQLANAEYNLRETTVTAPSDGYVTAVALRPGMRAVNVPTYRAMAFIDTSDTLLVGQIHQIYSRHIEPGQAAEVTFKSQPGRVYPATVRFAFPATAQGEARVTGTAMQPISDQPGPFGVRLDFDNEADGAALRPGSIGSVAIYTDSMAITHVIRKVMIRMEAILNYLRPA